MLTQENFYQGLEENCNQEQGAADFPEEIEFPLYDFLHKTPIWSLSTTLKEELAKYKRNVIQPAVTPLWILLIERAPSYEENMERVNKTRTPFPSRFQQIEVYVAQQQALGKTTAAEIYNAYKANDTASELCLIVGPRQVQYILDRQRRLKQVRETSNNEEIRLEMITFEARSTRTRYEKYHAYKPTDPACELGAFVCPRNPRIVQYNLDRQRRGKQVNVPKIRPHRKTSKLLELSEADQHALGTTTPAEIYNNLRANAPSAEVLTKIRPRNPRCVQYYLDRQKNYIA
jgi:hypothetical protein